MAFVAFFTELPPRGTKGAGAEIVTSDKYDAQYVIHERYVY
jgi:hypothetical protein